MFVDGFMKARLGDYIREYSIRNKANEDIPVYSVTNSQGFCKDYFGKEVASKNKSTYKIVPKGCFAYNPSRINVGSVDWQRNEERVIVSPLYNVFSVSSDLDNQYLYYFLKSDIALCLIKNIATGSVRDNLKLSMLYEVPINLPNIERQKEIVSTLDTLQSIITHLRTQLEKLDLLVKSRFVEMFKDVKDFVPLSFYINSLLAGKSLAGEESCKNKVLKTGAVSYNYFDNSQVKNLPNKYIPLEEHRVNDGDVIISRMNTSELVGAAAYVWEAPANTFLPDRLWKANLNEEANPIFIWQLLIQQTTKDEMKKIASGTSGSMKNISKSGLLGIKVIKIAFDAQTQFANFVKQVEKSRCALQQELTQTQTLLNSLMQEYFG